MKRHLISTLLAVLFFAMPIFTHAGPPFAEFVDPNPNTFGRFGTHVVPLSTGNVVITDPADSAGGTNAGAVYLFNGQTGALISTLTGSVPNTQAGSGGITVLANGNFVVSTPLWYDGTVVALGAVTWGSGMTGISGVISAANSLVGSSLSDQVGKSGVIPLSNGSYVVMSPDWDDGSVVNAGAVTWGDGSSGVSGIISAANSLIGSSTYDHVGRGGVVNLSNGNYVVLSPDWDNGTVVNAGAATWSSGIRGIMGPVNASNSLAGTHENDKVGSAATALANGSYVVSSPYWDNGSVADAGAATWADGTVGLTGTISTSNSLTGSTTADWVSRKGVTALTNGHYVVCSDYWDNGTTANAGAATWCNGTTGGTGAVSAANSLVGATSHQVGGNGAVALTNGNYVVCSPSYDGSRGAATWADGGSGLTGVVSTANSLTGTKIGDRVSSDGVIALTNGHYVVGSSEWRVTAFLQPDKTYVGAATWGNGTTGTIGSVTSGNSIVGSSANDRVGKAGTVTALANGHYVLACPDWDYGSTADAGAVKWCDGTAGSTGSIQTIGSLIGIAAGDRTGSGGVTNLTNGDYVVCSPLWDNGSFLADAGSVTRHSGLSGAKHSTLMGTTAGDSIGSGGVTALAEGHYAVNSPSRDLPGLPNAGSVTWCDGASTTVSLSDSFAGSSSNAGLVRTALDPVSQTFMAGFPTNGGGKVRLGSQRDGFAPAAPEIAITGNGQNITSGDSTPAAGDHTNFGRTTAGGGVVVRTFTVRSLGTGPVIFPGAGPEHVTLSGPDASAFTVTAQPANPVNALNGSTTFSITFAPSVPGVRQATVSLTSNDEDEEVFTFAIQGEGRQTVNAGENWVEQPGSGDRQWRYLTSSADGTKLAAVVNGGQIYTSTDSGLTWTARQTVQNWACITSSADGTKLAAVPSIGNIHTSTDSGVTWTPRESARVWSSITSSTDGVMLAATTNGGRIFLSDNSGVTWKEREASRGWLGIASSADGMKLAAVATNSQIYTSTDAGETWTPRESVRHWQRIACSADGSVLVATASTSLYVSTDSGVTWTVRDSPRGWTGVTCSADGSRMAASVNINGRIHTSTDYGVTWTPKAAPGDWGCVTSSADGMHLVAAIHNHAIWTSTGVLDPEITVRGNDLLIGNNDTSPDPADHTDFGSTAAAGGSVTRTFTIRNAGSLPLNLTDEPPVQISGLNAGDFTVATQPASPVDAAGGLTTFTIIFDPSAFGLRTATVSIGNDDSDRNPFSFAIAGTGVTATYAVTPVSGTNGSISPATAQTVTEGNTLLFTATAEPGYFVERWLVNGVQYQLGGDNFTLGPVTQAATVTALFAINPQAPAFTVQPQSLLALLGGPAEFAPAITGAVPMTFQWRKGVADIPNATGPGFTLPATVSSDIGAYSVVASNSQGQPVPSQTAWLGLVTPATATQVVRKGATLTLRCTATAPAITGVSLGYAWQFEGAPLVNGTQASGSVLSNVDKATMTLTKADAAHEGTYTCLVTLNTPGNDPVLTCGDIEVSVLDETPVLNSIPLAGLVPVSQTIDTTLTATGSPTGFSVTGLPRGLKLDSKTGRITGKPLDASRKDSAGNYLPNKLTFKATNAWGTGAGLDFFMVIEALPPALVGTYHGVVARSPHSNFGLGGRVQVTVSTAGALSGTATLAGQGHSFTGALDTSQGDDPEATVVFNRNPIALGSLRIRLKIITASGQMHGTIVDPLFAMTQGQFEAGDSALPGLTDGNFQDAAFNLPAGMVLRADGTGFIADTGNHVIRAMDPLLRTVTTFAGNGTSGTTDDFGTAAGFNSPEGLALDTAGRLFVADTGNSTIRVITPEGAVSTFAGAPGQTGGTNGTGAAARFSAPCGLCFDPAGNLYVVDRGNHTLRKITPTGVVTTVVGLAGTPGYKDGSGAVTRLNTPTGIVYDTVLRSLFITDTGNQVIRRIMLTGVVSTYAGAAGVAGENDGLAANARFLAPRGIITRGNGTLIVADTVLRQINSNGIVGTISEKLSAEDHPVSLAWHAPSASILALHDTLHSLSSHTATAPLEDATFIARRNPWTSTNTVPVAERARYNATLETTAAPDQAQFPLGSGHASVTIAANGTAVWTGKTADGSSLTFSTVMAEDRTVPLHAMTHANTGSLQGEAVINSATFSITGSTTSGFDWFKISQPLSKIDMSYKPGFPVHALNLYGGRYLPGNIHSYLGLINSPAPMRISLAESRVSAFQQAFTLTAPGKVTVPANTRGFTLSITAATGIFSGTFKEGSPAVTASYTGILFDDQTAGSRRGQGYFLLPDTTSSSSPLQSGVLTLEAVPPP